MVRMGILAATLLAATGGAIAADVGGSYVVDGTNFDGSRYGGTVTIKPTSDSTCTIKWNTGSTSSGLCMRSGNILAASYAFGSGGMGLVIYEIHNDGTLVGTWTQAGAKGMGTEILSPK